MINKVISRSFTLSFIITLILVFYLLFSFHYRSDLVNYIHIISVVTLIVYFITIKFISDKGDSISKSSFFLIISIYFLLFIFFFISLFFYQTGSFLSINARDSLFYHETVKRLEGLAFSDSINYLFANFDWDDIGALTYVYILYQFIESPLIIYISNAFLGLVSSVYLYKLSNLYLPKKESYLSSALFILSAYFIFFQVVLFKESLFVLLSILVIYNAQRSIVSKNKTSIFWFLFFVLLISFFRIGTSVLIIASYILYFILKGKKFKLRDLFLLIILTPVFLYFVWPVFDETYGYLVSSDSFSNREENIEYGYSSIVLVIISIFNSIFGPIPTFFSIKGRELSSYFYVGYLIKYFMSPYFVISIVEIVKSKNFKVYPLIIYYIVGSLVMGIILRGFDMRFLITHSFLFYLITFVGIHNKSNIIKSYKLFIYLFSIVLIVLLLVFNFRY